MAMTAPWNSMESAPKDGRLIEVRHLSKADGELIFRARWLEPRRAWVDWDRQHVTLTKLYLTGWRPSEEQFRPWTPEEVATLAEIHGPEKTTYLDPVAWSEGVRKAVSPPVRRSQRR
jgi:hypothetical protein